MFGGVNDFWLVTKQPRREYYVRFCGAVYWGKGVYIMRIIIKEISDYLRYCEKVRGMSKTTLTAKRYVLERFLKTVDIGSLEELTNSEFEKWVEVEMKRGVCAGTMNIYNSIIIAMVRYFREMGVQIPLNLGLIRKMKETPSRRIFYTAEEVERVVRLADFRTGLMIRIMFETGMRIAELCGLRISDFEGRRIRFIGKGKKVREVYLRAETSELTDRFIKEYGVSDYLWAVNDGMLTLNGDVPTVNTVRRQLRAVFLAAGLEGFYPHALRHSFATDLQARGASVFEIKEMIGHSSVATTERYLHGFEGRMRELFDKYGRG